MKIAILAASAAVAFTGLAQASAFQAGDNIISQTLTGIISGGSDTGPTGTNDDFNLFGGGDLLNAPVTVNFSYDITFISASANFAPDYQGAEMGFEDSSDPSGFLISVQIGSDSFSVTPTGFDDIDLCEVSICGDDEATAVAQDSSSLNFIQLAVANTDGSNLPLDFTVQSDVSGMFTNPDNSFTLQVGSGTNDAFDTLNFSVATPEPTTWLSLATGLAGLGLLKFRRRASAR